MKHPARRLHDLRENLLKLLKENEVTVDPECSDERLFDALKSLVEQSATSTQPRMLDARGVDAPGGRGVGRISIR